MIADILKNKLGTYEEAEKRWPNRHESIHKSPCKHCPAHLHAVAGTIGPESIDIKSLPKEVIAREYLFVCAWRPNKLCKGECDYMEIDQEYLNQLHNGDK